MDIVCVKCGAGVAYGLGPLADQTVVVCSGCGTGLRVAIQAQVVDVPVGSSPPRSGSSPARGRVVVAVEGEATRDMIHELLSGAGFDVIEVAGGREVVARVNEEPPSLVLVDVNLPDMIGSQVCEEIRSFPRCGVVKIILVAAIHNKARYRREPGNLFGADDFIERHQIEGHLVNKVLKLLPADPSHPASVVSMSSLPMNSAQTAQEAAGAPASQSAPPIAASPSLRPVADPAPPPSVSPGPVSKPSDPGREAALRLARIIISDIALYNAKKVDESVLQGTFFDVMRHEIEEGRRLYEERRPADLLRTVDLFQQTLEQFVATRKQLLRRTNQAAA